MRLQLKCHSSTVKCNLYALGLGSNLFRHYSIHPRNVPMVIPQMTMIAKSSDDTCDNNSNNKIDLADTVSTNMLDKIDWDDRIGVQDKWTNEAKGWKVNVEWKQTPFGAGLFALQDIPAETVLRVGKNGRNLVQFRSVDDIDEFCGKLKDDNDETSSDDNLLDRSRLLYVKDYLWGFNPQADERGYDIPSALDETASCTDDEKSKPQQEDLNRFFGMWIPGNGLNHHLEPNTVYRPNKEGGVNEGIDLVALKEISSGDELWDDYRRHGKASLWLRTFAEVYQVSLNFSDCNDFVRPGIDTNTNMD